MKTVIHVVMQVSAMVEVQDVPDASGDYMTRILGQKVPHVHTSCAVMLAEQMPEGQQEHVMSAAMTHTLAEALKATGQQQVQTPTLTQTFPNGGTDGQA